MTALDRARKYQRTINRLEWLKTQVGVTEAENESLSRAQGFIRDAWQSATRDYAMNGDET